MTGETMTLVFEFGALKRVTKPLEFGALKRVTKPQAVVVDARRWAQHVCLATTDPGAAQTFSTVNLLRWDCQVEPAVSTFQQLSQRFQTERYVLVGAPSERPDYLPADQWDYRGLTAAASAASWEIETQHSTLRQRWADRVASLRRLSE